VQEIETIDRDEMAGLAAEEYDRMFDLLESLSEHEWRRPTVCDDWDVHEMVAHLLGAAESNASILESVRQLVRGRTWARTHGRPEIDGINAVQVADREHIDSQDLLHRLRTVAPKAIAGRRVPSVLRGIRMENPAGGRMTMGHLMDRVYTRDQWMHRLDIGDAIGRAPVLTHGHDGRIVEDVVAEWAEVQPGPWTLELTGPAGGVFINGEGGQTYRFDAIEWCLVVSGRRPHEPELALVVF
jgi:uncharacterized protein (TIGR03083 family)